MNNSLLNRGLWRRRTLAAVVLLALAGADKAGAITAPAKVAFIEGQVEILRNGSKTPEPAEIGMNLYWGDQVKTKKGKCQLNMTASGILRLSENTTVLFPTEENKGDKISVWNMLFGKAANKGGRGVGGVLFVDEVFEVRTPTLVAGVREPGIYDDSPNHGQLLEEWRQGRRQEIERLRAEGNAKLDAIRAELKQKEGKPITYPCPTCGSNGPHRWTTEGWECNCGATAVTFGDYPTSQGTYNKVREYYRLRIEAIEQEIRR